MIQLFLVDCYGQKNYEINVNNTTLGSEVRRLFFELSQSNPEEYKTKMLFGGTEILDNHRLCQFKLDNEYKIQVIKTKKENS